MQGLFKLSMQESFRTIEVPAEGLYKVKGSKFLSFAFPVNTVDEIKLILDESRKTYYDARHVCYAWVLGADRLEFRANDDGEPSGTAGRPILGQLHSRDLTNVLVIVVRYFGGVLLGTGGLIVAYREAAAEALNMAQIVENDVVSEIRLTFDYLQLNGVMKAVKDTDAHILSQNFENRCELHLSVTLKQESTLLTKLGNIDGLEFIS